MITSREFSILCRIARLVIHDHRSDRLDLAVKKLVSEKGRAVAQFIINGTEDRLPLAKKIVAAAKAQFQSEELVRK